MNDESKTNKKGIIYLTGSGPGDEKLLTVKAVEVLKSSDVVVYDYLATNVDLDKFAPQAEKIYVGKRGRKHFKEQGYINDLLVKLGKEGKKVVRLKGGDPFVFGRGGEEASALSEAGINYEVIPGITSGYAAAAYAGTPVTQRG
ncbi:MAG TPA: uroporphyrinogen-III C-methyltransferase, partial [Actinobacteria bacterium]|nr:uroporphyrinogen-III C-methyltransferase [Actinomycetota bacterium]